MKKKIMLMIMVSATLLLALGCESKKTVQEEESTVVENAIYPVMQDKKKGIKSRKIELTDFTLTLPEGYVYGKVENEDHDAYYVWQDKEDKEYAMALDGDIMLYVYEGIDDKSPHEELTDVQARSSFVSKYFEYLRSGINGSFNSDALVTVTGDGANYVCCFDGHSGDYLTTTYSELCYPKTYYGVYLLQKTTNNYERKFSGFVFSNDSTGEIFKESEYNALFSQIKTAYNITEFFSVEQSSLEYDPLKDLSSGRNYEQMIDLFENTYLYYVETIGKPWERENVDESGNKETNEIIKETDESVQVEDTSEINP